LCVQDDRACHRRFEDNAPGDAELCAEVVGAGGKDNTGDGCVGECTGQAGAGAHRGLQRTALARPRAHDGCGVRELSPVLLAARGRRCRGRLGGDAKVQ
jgi:hypothetical protein